MEKWTLNSVWYNFLSVLKEFETTATRGYVKQLVNELCESAGCTRESLRIFAGVRASLYFQGDWTSVSFDAVDSLAEKGTDILFIEKEGIPEVLTEYADKFGIAMVNTRGYLTEYGKDLMQAADASGSHVAVMTDYDLTGIHIASKSTTNMPWIGVDDATLEYFNLDRDDIAVEATNVRLADTVKALVRIDRRFKAVDIDFLESQRVEIDAILSQVGGEKLWEFIQEKLTKLYQTRDYNRAITMPAVETLYQPAWQELLTFINTYHNELIADKDQEITKALREVTGMIDIEEKKKQIQDEFQSVVDTDVGVKVMTPFVKQLLAKLKKKKTN
jgi:hypothetical protein